MENASFCGPPTWIVVFIKPSLLEESLSHKKGQKSAYSVYSLKWSYARYKSLYYKTSWIVWARSKKITCRMTLVSLFMNTINCFLHLILHFRSVARIVTQFLSPLTSGGGGGVNLGRRRALIWWGGGGGSGFIEITILNFTSQLLFELLFTYRLKDVVSLVLFHKCF